MSLVNDMLRDLDRRREQTGNGAASFKLMPATDMPVERRNRILLVVLGCLVLAAVGLTYVWLQQADGDSPRQLNIRPAVVENEATPPAPLASTPPVQAAVAQSEATGAAVEPASPGLSAPTPASPATTAEVQTREPAGLEQTEAATPIQPTAPDATTASASTPRPTETGQSGPSESIDERQVAQNQPSGALDSAPQEQVKNSAAMSSDQLDTMAVQQALRLIENNDSAAAYAHLEQHIINNRYAHQSRETYAKLLMNDGETLAAYNLLESGLGLAPNHAGYKKVKARILIANGQMEESVDLLSRRPPEVSADLEYHEILATAQLASRDYQGALISYTSLVQQDRSQGKWWYGFAASQDSLGNTRAAYQGYNQAIQQRNLSPNLRRRSQERISVLSQ